MSRRDRAIFIGIAVGGLLGASIAYLLAPPREPGEEQTSLLANLEFRDALTLTKSALGFVQQVNAVKQKGPKPS